MFSLFFEKERGLETSRRNSERRERNGQLWKKHARYLQVGEVPSLPLASTDVEADLDLVVYLVAVYQRNLVLEEFELHLLRVHFVGSYHKLTLHKSTREGLGLLDVYNHTLDLKLCKPVQALSFDALEKQGARSRSPGLQVNIK